MAGPTIKGLQRLSKYLVGKYIVKKYNLLLTRKRSILFDIDTLSLITDKVRLIFINICNQVFICIVFDFIQVFLYPNNFSRSVIRAKGTIRSQNSSTKESDKKLPIISINDVLLAKKLVWQNNKSYTPEREKFCAQVIIAKIRTYSKNFFFQRVKYFFNHIEWGGSSKKE